MCYNSYSDVNIDLMTL